MEVNSASCAAYWVVKDAGMCCTRKMAAGKSRVKPGARRMTVAGPPVDAANTTTGNRWSRLDFRAGCGATGAGAVCGAPFDFCSVEASLEAVRTTRTFAAIRTLR